MLRSIRVIVGVLVTALTIGVSPNVLAHSDIEAVVIGGKLVVDEENSVPVAYGTGFKIFEGDFGDLTGGPLQTDDPGFMVPDATLLSGQQLWYNAIGSLSFWDGLNWGAAPGTLTLKIEDALGSDTLITSSGVTNPYGVIDQADTGGGVHAHIDFSISDLNPAGAYLATFELTSRDVSGNLPSPYVDSDPFQVVFNRGLSSQAFETSVSALVSPVPEPETYAMLLAGLAVFAGIARRRQGMAS